MQNFTSYWLHGIRAQGRIALPVGSGRTSFIDTRDIADVATELLLRSDLDGKAFELTGAEALNHAEVAAVLGKAAGRDIVFDDVSEATARDALLTAGLPAAYVELLLMLMSHVKAGAAERTTDGVQQVIGRPPRRFADYAAEQRAAWATPG